MADSPGRRRISFPNSKAPSEAPPRRRRYGRRKGWKLRPHQAELVEKFLPQLSLVPQKGADPKSYFTSAVHDVWFEIGFGAGEHLAAQAEANPDTGLIGAEPFVAGIAKLLSRIERGRLSNIRLYTEDARELLDALPDASLGCVFLLFPDPWPKTRHHKRRFVQEDTLDTLARVMKPGAELRFATDDAPYLTWALERFVAHPGFRWLAETASDWRVRPPDWPQTRYDAKAIKQGRSNTYLRFARSI